MNTNTLHTIWKFPLNLRSGPQMVMMPEKALILRVAAHHGEPTMWARVSDQERQIVRYFAVIGTGSAVPASAIYCGSCDIGSLVCHVFELPLDSAVGTHVTPSP